MKKQNANNRLAFNKVAVIELNDTQMYSVDGGTTPACIAAAASSGACAGAALAYSSAACAGLASAAVGLIAAWALD